MPAAAVASMAKKAGVSIATAEKRWDAAKASAAKGGRKNDYAYIMGIFKKMMGQHEMVNAFGFGEAVAKSRASMLLEGKCEIDEAIDSVAQGDYRVRAFLDCGFVHFATPDDVTLELSEDPRLEAVAKIVNDVDWPSGHAVYRCVDNYEGSLQDLYTQVTQAAEVTEVIKPRHKSLEQKRGHRKASRTRIRDMRAESDSGYLYYYYYKQSKRDKNGNPTSR